MAYLGEGGSTDDNRRLLVSLHTNREVNVVNDIKCALSGIS